MAKKVWAEMRFMNILNDYGEWMKPPVHVNSGPRENPVCSTSNISERPSLLHICDVILSRGHYGHEACSYAIQFKVF